METVVLCVMATLNHISVILVVATLNADVTACHKWPTFRSCATVPPAVFALLVWCDWSRLLSPESSLGLGG